MPLLNVFYIFPDHLSEYVQDSIRQNHQSSFFYSCCDYLYHPITMKYVSRQKYDKMNDMDKIEWFHAHFRSTIQPILIIFFPNRVFFQDDHLGQSTSFSGKNGVFYGILSTQFKPLFSYHIILRYLSQWESNSIQIIKKKNRLYFTDLINEDNPPHVIVSHDTNTILNLQRIHDFFSKKISPDMRKSFNDLFGDIYIITLPQRRTRLTNVLTPFQWDRLHFHDAVPADSIKNNPHQKFLNNGQIACFLSHQIIYTKFLNESTHDFLWIMEDDIYFPLPFGIQQQNSSSLEWMGQKMNRIFHDLQSYDPDWDLFYWGHCWDTTLPNHMHPPGLSKKISRIKRPYCTHAFMIRRRVLQHYFKTPYRDIRTPIDQFWLQRIQKDKLRVYASPIIYQNPHCTSNIGYIIDFNRRFPVHVTDMMIRLPILPIILFILLILMLLLIRREIFFRIVE